MTSRLAPGLAALPLLAGCVYLNSLYNAQDRFQDGERARLEGRTLDAEVAYEEAIRKAARGYRKEPDGPWADDALYVLGRAYLRTNDLARAGATLEEVIRITDDPEIRRGASLYLGAARTLAGDAARALPLLARAIQELPMGALRGEGHYWRARALLSEGRLEQGWWDLEQAARNDGRLAVPAHLERLTWGVLRDDRERARAGARALLTIPSGADQVDSLEVAVVRAARRWGPAAAAELLAPGRGGGWPPAPKDRILLTRARLLVSAGDTLAAESEAGWVSEGVGPGALEARIFVARLRLAQATSVEGLAGARSILLPQAGRPEVADLAEDLRTVELLAAWGEAGSPTALFAAGELARDRLGAERLARSFFLAAASADSPWRVKSALAALALDPDADDAEALRGWIVSRSDDPYRGAALNAGPARSEELDRREERLARELEAVVARARAEALRRDVRLRGDTVGGAGS